MEHAERRGPVAVLALHAGLEGGTAELATTVADRCAQSLYLLLQCVEPVHLASHRYEPATPALAGVLEHAEVALSLHGFGRWEQPRHVMVGGADDDLAAEAAEVLQGALPGYVVVAGPDVPADLRGRHRANPVNRTPLGGVQLELPHRARGSRPGDRYRGLPTAPDPDVVEALVVLTDHLAALAGR